MATSTSEKNSSQLASTSPPATNLEPMSTPETTENPSDFVSSLPQWLQPGVTPGIHIFVWQIEAISREEKEKKYLQEESETSTIATNMDKTGSEKREFKGAETQVVHEEEEESVDKICKNESLTTSGNKKDN